MILSDNDINLINKFMHKLHYLLDNKILKYINKNQLIFYYNKFIRVSINLNDINDIKFYAISNIGHIGNMGDNI